MSHPDPTKTYVDFGKETTKEEHERIRIEMALNDLGSSIKMLKKLGVANKFIFGEIINSFDYSDLNDLGSDIDGYLRGREYK